LQDEKRAANIEGGSMLGNAILVAASKDEGMSTPEPGLRRQVMSYSPGLMLVRHTMVKGWAGARHSHPHEQMVYIVRGRIRFEHPGGVEHQASALEDSEVLDIFTPMREDYAT
jgi:quercetin dioxygenase-like cupin family protein